MSDSAPGWLVELLDGLKVPPEPDGYAGLIRAQEIANAEQVALYREMAAEMAAARGRKKRRTQITIDPVTWSRLAWIAEKHGGSVSATLEALALYLAVRLGPQRVTEQDLRDYGLMARLRSPQEPGA